MLWGLILLLVVGLLAGFIANALMHRQSKSLLMNTLLGVAGAFIGSWLVRILGFYPNGDFLPTLITAVIGSTVLLWLANLLNGRTVRF